MPRTQIRLVDPPTSPPIILLPRARPRLALPPARHEAPDVPDPPAPIILGHHRPRAERHAWRRILRQLIHAL